MRRLYSVRSSSFPAIIELRHIRKSFGDLPVLQDVSLTVDRGRTVALVGASGSGKSTMLRVLAGLIPVDAGTAEIEGTPIDAWVPRALRLRIGFVIQGGGLFPHLSARDNVTLMPRTLGWAPSAIAARVSELAEAVRLPSRFLDGFPARLSGGQNQRVALMRALMLDPDILLMDEPLGALDPVIRSELQDDLVDLFRRLEKTVVFVTHNLPEAAMVAHELALLAHGRIEQRGTLETLVRNPVSQTVERFVGAHRVPAALAGGGSE